MIHQVLHACVEGNPNSWLTSQKLQGNPMSVSTIKESQQSIGPLSIIFGTLGTGFGASGLFGVTFFKNVFALTFGVCNLALEGFITVLAEEGLRANLGLDRTPERLL